MSSKYEQIGADPQHGHENFDQSKNTTGIHGIALRNLSRHGQRTNETSPGPNDNGPNKPRPIVNNRFSRFWIWELLASVFSLICIAVIVIVLLYENGRRLDHWNLLIPPNAVISFIAALAKSSCVLVLAEIIGQLRWAHLAQRSLKLKDLQVYDDASRGPWGAIKLVLRSRPGAILASLASVLMIAALLIDPFSQLVLTFESRAVPSPDQKASMGVAKAYDAHTLLWQNHAGGAGIPENAPFGLQSAIISAAFGSPPAFQLECPTSNCTFPPISTFGVCSTCQDILNESTTTCKSGQSGYTCNTLMPTQSFPQPPGFSSSASANASSSFRFHWTSSHDADGAYGLVWNSSSFDVVSPLPNPTLPYGEPAVLGAFTAMRVNANTVANVTLPKAPSQLSRCNITYCLKTYEGIEVQNGKTNIGPVTNVPMRIASRSWGAYTGSDILFNMSATTNGTTKNYTINYVDYLNTAQYVADILNSAVNYQAYSYASLKGGTMAPTVGLAMYNSDNISLTMDNVADSMTNAMRTTQDNQTTTDGTALVVVTYIHIEWRWLALPILIALLSLVLLVIVIVRTKSSGVEAWKSSSLPLLFYDIDGWRDQTKDPTNAKDASEASNDMRSRLLLDKHYRVFQRSDTALSRAPE